ncbi:hypothetical protein CDD83_6498 [Cordyceps sp. RAO-2017]|nr:hypothetical protein CDD83_6498 [Cordyceps sp. RAO-2017]
MSAQSTQATQAKARGKCPGCQLVHRMKGDSWWQTCWVFDAYMGRDTSPSWFISRDDRIECVRERLTANPKEEKQAIAWDSRR